MSTFFAQITRTFYQMTFAMLFLVTGYLAMIAGENGEPSDLGFAALDAPVTEARILMRTGTTAEMVRGVQRELATRGYQPGSLNGDAGLQTRAAIMAWQHDTGRVVTGEATEALLQAMIFGARPAAKTPGTTSGAAREITRAVEKLLAELGYVPGPVDGKADTQTANAIKAFEKDRSMPSTGRISGRLIAEIRLITRS